LRKRARRTTPRTGEKTSGGGKGLRHFSMKVCEKVKSKGRTTYQEVADELVREFSAPEVPEGADQAYDEKNIRRRVYDALNVLMAMNIIGREKKEVRWVGLPEILPASSTSDYDAKQNLLALQAQKKLDIRELQKKKDDIKERVKAKTQHLQELLLQQIAYKNTMERNYRPEYANEEARVELPFIIINCRRSAVIKCEMSDKKDAVSFEFDTPFEIHDDTEILQLMCMQDVNSYQDLPHLIPAHLIRFLPEQYRLQWNSGGAAYSGATTNSMLSQRQLSLSADPSPPSTPKPPPQRQDSPVTHR